MELEIVSKISNINPIEWNKINVNGHPFTSHEFLSSLEDSKTVSAETGWQPQHIVLKSNNKIVGALPNYLKSHSYGEYVFDHSWANAYERAGGNYYPKLISAIPFTPVNGPRFLYNADHKEDVIKLISQTLKKLTLDNKLSSCHINFLSKDFRETLKSSDWIERTGLQFHWENKGFKNFDDFLRLLKSQKRKMIKKERNSIINSNISIKKLTGNEITSSIWDKFYSFYLKTIEKKWGGAYLNRSFFQNISDKMGSKILLIIALKDEKVIAGALNFIGKKHLYGRNWGAVIDIPFLHFELCYYQAIDFAIENNIQIVEAGAQGPHKIKRGYLAKPTFSYHYIPHQSFRNAITNFVKHEKKEISNQIKYVNTIGTPYLKI